MSPFDYLTRAEPFDPRGTPYAGDAQAQPLNALARIFGQEETVVDPTRRYGSANALRGTPDAYWSEAMMTPGQRTARNILASEPVQTVMNWANFAGPAMRAIPRPTMAAEGTGGIRAYHGSPHDFDKFDMSKIGTGEGAQAYGHGLYFAESKDVAKSYAGMHGSWELIDSKGRPVAHYGSDNKGWLDILGQNGGNYDKAIAEMEALKTAYGGMFAGNKDRGIAQFKKWRDEGLTPRPLGKTYEVRINASPDDFLDYDAPLSQQSDRVRKAVEAAGWKSKDLKITDQQLEALKQDSVAARKRYDQLRSDYFADAWKDPRKSEADFNNSPEAWRAAQDVLNIHSKIDAAIHEREALTGKGVLESLTDSPLFGRTYDKAAATVSSKLRDAGVPGIKYLDQQSRGTGEGTRNYVVFRDDIIDILKKYGLAGLLAGGAAATQGQEAKASP